MRPQAIAAILLALAAPAAAQVAADPPAAARPAQPKLTIDSTFFELVADPRTRAVLDRHLPGLCERLMSDEEVATLFGGVTLAGMAVDPDHGRMFTPQVLEMFARELAEAQAEPPPPS